MSRQRGKKGRQKQKQWQNKVHTNTFGHSSRVTKSPKAVKPKFSKGAKIISQETIFETTDNGTIFWKMGKDGVSSHGSR